MAFEPIEDIPSVFELSVIEPGDRVQLQVDLMLLGAESGFEMVRDHMIPVRYFRLRLSRDEARELARRLNAYLP